MSSFLLYYIIVAVWEYLFIHSSPTHTAAGVKAKAANWDVYFTEPKTFFWQNVSKIVSSRLSRDETRRLETNFTDWRLDYVLQKQCLANRGPSTPLVSVCMTFRLSRRHTATQITHPEHPLTECAGHPLFLLLFDRTVSIYGRILINSPGSATLLQS